MAKVTIAFAPYRPSQNRLMGRFIVLDWRHLLPIRRVNICESALFALMMEIYIHIFHCARDMWSMGGGGDDACVVCFGDAIG